MKPRIVKTLCANCKNNGTCSFNLEALFKTACSIEMELYNHGVEDIISEIVLPCKHYCTR